MSDCDTCGQLYPNPLPIKYMTLVTPKSSTIVSRKGKHISLLQPLYSVIGKPQGGWGFNVVINGVDTKISGATGGQVFSRTAKRMTQNGMQFTPSELWYSMNLQWYARTPHDKYKLVTDKTLAELGQDVGEDSKIDRRDYHHPEVWGSIAWRSMGLFLSQDTYTWEGFIAHVEWVLSLLDPSRNPSTGCIDCYRKFAQYVAALRMRPLHDRYDARIWLHKIHNQVNLRLEKPQITFQEASKLNFWT